MKTKKYLLSVVFLSLLFGPVTASGGVINDVDGLFAAAASGGNHTIVGGTYDLSLKSGGGKNLGIVHDLILVPTGDVVIDGNDLYKVNMVDCNATIGDSTNTYRITFTDPNYDTVYVRSWEASPQITFYYCDFANAKSGNCLSIYTYAADPNQLNVTCYDCRAYGATGTNRDGFNCKSSTANGTINLTLVDCEAYDNADDGVTAHNLNTTVKIIGGKYHDNTYGIQFINGSVLEITGDTEIYDNSLYGVHHTGSNGGMVKLQGDISIHDNKCNLLLQGTVHGFADGCTLYNSKYGDIIQTEGTASLAVRNCTLYDPNDDWWALRHDSSGLLAVDGCVFYSTGSTADIGAIYSGTAAGTAITNSIIYAFNNTNDTAIYTETGSKSFINHCTIYDCTYGIAINDSAAISNCILADIDNYAIGCPSSPGTYYNKGGGGYNYFYNNGTNFYQAGSAQQNDIEATIPPGFADAENGDFRLKPNSPCLNAGSKTPGKDLINTGWSSIGAWQGLDRSVIPPANCTEPLEMDFNNDCKVDFEDFAMFSQTWLDCNLDPPEACWQ